jgi:hypothetical protein
MALTNAAKNLMLDELAGVAVFASLHTADPSTTGANEVAGGAYTREAITWNAASAGSLDNNANPVFDVPAGTTVTHYGLWSAASGGTFYAGDDLSASETFTGAGTYSLLDVDLSIS